jgi:hypothetical protein
VQACAGQAGQISARNCERMMRLQKRTSTVAARPFNHVAIDNDMTAMTVDQLLVTSASCILPINMLPQRTPCNQPKPGQRV